MRLWNNLSILVKALAAPLLGSMMVLVIGWVFYSTSHTVEKHSQQSNIITEVDTAVTQAKMSFALLNIKANNVVTLQFFGADEKKVNDAIVAVKKLLVETSEKFNKIDWDVATTDKAVSTDIKDNFRAYSAAFNSLSEVLTSEISLSSMYLNTCNVTFDAAIQRLTAVEKSLVEKDIQLQHQVDEELRSALTTVLSFVGGAVVVLMVAGFSLGRAVSKPVQAITCVMRELADGNLKITVPFDDRTDEIGEMAKAVNVFKENAEQIEKMKVQQSERDRVAAQQKKAALEELAAGFEASVGHIVSSVASAATELQANAQNLTTTADQTSRLSVTVASATEEASSSVQTVASASEELSASIGEISHQVQESTQVAVGAVEEVKRTDVTVSSLSEAAAQIGDVVKLIQSIAEQTNLLALNATIEAARAGDAGKGFAVVASEVKNLANQTARATDEISSKILTVQTVSGEAVNAIRSIGKTIGRINEVSGVIANAIQQQNSATREISDNVQKAFMGTSRVSNDIGNVTQAASESRRAADEVLQASGQLSKQSELLRNEIHSFLLKLRGG